MADNRVMDIIRTITTTALVTTLLGLSAFSSPAGATTGEATASAATAAKKCRIHSRAQRFNCRAHMASRPYLKG